MRQPEMCVISGHLDVTAWPVLFSPCEPVFVSLWQYVTKWGPEDNGCTGKTASESSDRYLHEGC